jgi:hypothetical protein
MADQVVLVPHPDDERRWKYVQARAEVDRRTARRLFGLLLVIIATFLVWAFVQLA